jgi:hypothetical protein
MLVQTYRPGGPVVPPHLTWLLSKQLQLSDQGGGISYSL